MVNPRCLARPIVFALLLSALLAASESTAFGQFTLTSQLGLSPVAVDPGGTAIASLDLSGSSGSVSFSCLVTPAPTAAPTCAVSPASATPPAVPSLTVSTAQATPAGLYTIVVTGTSGATSVTLNLDLTVLNVAEDYTLSVLPATANPSPVTAGDTATTTVTATPIGSYSGNITFACLSVTPIVAAEPYCTFTYPNNQSYVVVNGAAASATLTMTTFGPIPTTTKLWKPHPFYAFWLAIPGLALVGVGSARGRKKRLLGMLLLAAIASGVLLMPSCGTNNTNNPTGQSTPKNTYVFTITAIDANGVAPSNSTTSAATVSLKVN